MSSCHSVIGHRIADRFLVEVVILQRTYNNLSWRKLLIKLICTVNIVEFSSGKNDYIYLLVLMWAWRKMHASISLPL